MLLKIDEQIRSALDRGQQAKTTASPEWRSSVLSMRAMADLDWQPRRRLEHFSDEVKRTRQWSASRCVRPAEESMGHAI